MKERHITFMITQRQCFGNRKEQLPRQDRRRISYDYRRYINAIFVTCCNHYYIPGQSNVVADFLSQAWILTDGQIVSHFDSKFPHPKPWTLCSLCKPMNLSLILVLLKKRCAMPSLLHTRPPRILIGTSGVHSALLTTSMCSSSATSLTVFHTCKSLPFDMGTAKFLQAADSCRLQRFLMPFFMLHRNLRGWG